jgi:hypothetical protein
MAFDPLRFRALVRSLSGDCNGERGLGSGDARAIVAIATLAADVDLDEPRNEADLLVPLAAELAARARVLPETLASSAPRPQDKTERVARIHELATELTGTRSRELAYVAAYLVAIDDLELAPVESAFLDELRPALELTEARAAELAETAAQALTPGATPAMEVRTES